jgi:hypothetical protein
MSQYYLIWSEEHGQWWESRWNYTHFIERAARFTKEEADKLVAEGNYVIDPSVGRFDRSFNEIAIPDPIPWPRYETPQDRS